MHFVYESWLKINNFGPNSYKKIPSSVYDTVNIILFALMSLPCCSNALLSSPLILLDMLRTFCRKILLLHSDQLDSLLTKMTFLFQALNKRLYSSQASNLLQKYKLLRIKMED